MSSHGIVYYLRFNWWLKLCFMRIMKQVGENGSTENAHRNADSVNPLKIKIAHSLSIKNSILLMLVSENFFATIRASFFTIIRLFLHKTNIWLFYVHFLPLDKCDICKTGSLKVQPCAIKVIVNRRSLNSVYYDEM